MPFRSFIQNAEVMKVTPVETSGGANMLRLLAKTWNSAGKGRDPIEVVFQAVVFKPTDELMKLKSGDKINIGSSDAPASTKVDSNPNFVQVRKNDLGASEPETYPSRFVEVTAFGEQVEIVAKKDPTRSSNASKPSKRTSSMPSSDHDDDDLPF